MPVKPSQTGTRILAALGMIATHQPVGVSELARLLSANIAATQRAIATLAEEGWIRAAIGKPTRWELTAYIHTVAQHAYGAHDLRRRARGLLEELCKETGESVLLNVPDGGKFIVIDVIESARYVRSAPPIGLVIPAKASATAWALLPYMPPAQQEQYLGEAADEPLLKKFARTIEHGFSVSRGDVSIGSTNIAAPIFEIDGRPVGAVLISIPNDRAGPENEDRLGHLVQKTAQRLSRGAPPNLLTAAAKGTASGKLIDTASARNTAPTGKDITWSGSAKKKLQQRR
jgi:IclR family acetate operon transcriptional repressor